MQRVGTLCCGAVMVGGTCVGGIVGGIVLGIVSVCDGGHPVYWRYMWVKRAARSLRAEGKFCQ